MAANLMPEFKRDHPITHMDNWMAKTRQRDEHPSLVHFFAQLFLLCVLCDLCGRFFFTTEITENTEEE